MFKCVLFRYEEMPMEDYYIDMSPLNRFDDILDEELTPFHDEDSVKFLSEVYGIEYVDGMHFSEDGMQYYLHSFSESVKEFLMLLRNSKKGIYTRISEIQPKIVKYAREFKNYDFLFAYDVMLDGSIYDLVTRFNPMEVVNYTFRGNKCPVTVTYRVPEDARLVYKTGEWFELYEKDGKLFTGNTFFTLFDYDFKRDLPDIQTHIEHKYKDYKFFDSYGRHCTCRDLLSVINIKVINHMMYIPKLRAEHRKIACLGIFYMNDDSVVLKANISVKYPYITELIEDNYLTEKDIRLKFILFVDVEERMKQTRDIDSTWFGAYFYRDYVELYGENDALLELLKQIPRVLKNMRIPILKDYDIK